MPETYKISGFKSELTHKQQILARTLIEENGFKPKMIREGAKTVSFEKGRKYGYINGDVTKYGGVLGFTFPLENANASPHETKEKTKEWFGSKYPGSSGKITFHSVPSKNSHYLIILDVDLALKVCGVTSKTKRKPANEESNDSDYQQIQAECIKCFQKIGVSAEFTEDGNIIRCMKEKVSSDWPKDWIEYVVKNAGSIIKGVEIRK